MTITIEKIGRRHYLRGNTYPIKDAIKSAGGHWDGDQRAWWISDAAAAERIVGGASSPQTGEAQIDQPGMDAIVAGRVEYKGKTFYLAGRTERGRTVYDDRVVAVESRDGAKVLLYARDGSFKFWADRGAVSVGKTYRKPQSIRSLRDFAEEAKAGFPNRRTCHYCGSPNCEGARGGLCEED